MAAFDADFIARERLSLAVKKLEQGRDYAQRRGIVPVAYLHADLGGDQPLKFIAVSDSTGDGVGIPEHTSNNPGNVDWGADPKGAKAWPQVLENRLIQMHPHRSTANLKVHNASRSGWTVEDFLSNFNARLTDNEFYGVSNYAFLSLGLNNAEEMMFGQKGDTYVSNFLKLLRQLLDWGIMPILTPADPCGLQRGYYGTYAAGTAVDNRVVEFFLNRIAEMCADIVGCMYLDHNTPMKAVMAHGYTAPALNGAVGNAPRAYELWDTTFTPYLHGGEAWNRLKADTLAMLMTPKVITLRPGERAKSTTRFAETTVKPDSLALFSSALRKNGQGGTETIANTAAQNNVELLDTWIWCDTADASMIYRATNGDGISSGAAASTHPKVRHWSTWDNVTTDQQSPTFAWSEQGSMNGQSYVNAHRTDQPAVIQSLQPGLNRLSYLTGTHASERYLGYFDLYPARLKPQSNALHGLGRLELARPAGATGRRSIWAPEDPELHNVLALKRGDEQHILYKGNLPDGFGLVLCHNQRQLSDAVHGHRTGVMAYRNGDNLELRFCHTETVAGAFATGRSNAFNASDAGVTIAGGALTHPGDDQELRFTLKVTLTGGVLVWRIDVFHTWAPQPAPSRIFAVELTPQSGGPILPAMAGVVGGLVSEGGNVTAKSATIEHLSILRTPNDMA